MRNPLRILSIEDDPKDSKLIQDLLETEDIVCEVTRVDTQAALEASLEQGGIDLILADYTLPSKPTRLSLPQPNEYRDAPMSLGVGCAS